jgi:hypothetical protein
LLPSAGVDREPSHPAHAQDDEIILRDVIQDLVGLPGEQLLAGRDAGDDPLGVALATRRVDEIRTLDEADVARQ